MARLGEEGAAQRNVVNDLEQPAFDTLPELAELKKRLQDEGDFTSGRHTSARQTCFRLDGAACACSMMTVCCEDGIAMRCSVQCS